MLDERVRDVEDVVGEVGIAARPVRQQRLQTFFGQLRDIAFGACEDRMQSAPQLVDGKDFLPFERYPGDAGNVGQYLAIGPLVASRDDRNLSQAEARELVERRRILEHVPRSERYLVPRQGTPSYAGTQCSRSASTR